MTLREVRLARRAYLWTEGCFIEASLHPRLHPSHVLSKPSSSQHRHGSKGLYAG